MVEQACYPAWRTGHPRVVEAMNRHDGGRSTGYFGTGVYFYTSEEAMKKDRNFVEGKQPGFKIECMCNNPLIVGGARTDWNASAHALHLLGKSMVREVRATEKGEEPLLGYDAIPACDEDYELCQDLIHEAIRRTESCLETFGHWSNECVQPINHLLQDLGYDCVYPIGDFGESNAFGGVLLKEEVKRCLGEVTMAEDIPLEDFFAECFGPVEIYERPGSL